MKSQNKKFRLAVLTSHPIEYQGPFFKKLVASPEIDLMVYFCWDFGIKETYEPSFNQMIKWKIPLLEGYDHKFLKNFALRKTSANFFGEINPGIVSDIFKNKYDAILILGWQVLTDWLAFFAAFLSGTPILIRGENPYDQEIIKSKPKLLLKRLVLGLLFKATRAILYIGEENRKFYRYYGVPEKKLFSMPYAVDNERFIKEAKELEGRKSSLKNSFGIDSEKITILFVGKLVEKKRPMDLLRAYVAIGTNKKALVFMGDGPLRKEIEGFVESNNLQDVRITGFIDPLDIKNFYAMADLFVLPSGIGETWGLVVNEAMCFSLPIIVSDMVGCGPDLVHHGENGFTFPCGNTDRLKEYLEVLMNDSKLRKSFGEQSKKIIARYNYEKDVEGILIALGL